MTNLGQIVAYYKYQTTKHNEQTGNPGTRLWQRNYYERIVRNDEEMHRFSEYIRTNPLNWRSDRLHPSAPPNPFNQETHKSV
jgi:REP element-mobilizing transposase RayT